MIGIHFAGSDLSRSGNRLAISCGVVNRRPDGSGDPHPYEDLAAYGAGRWCVRDIDEADVVVYALPYRDDEDTRAAAEAARSRGLPIVFFRPTDDPSPERPPHGVVYRTSLYRSRLTPAELAMPGMTDDLLAERDGEVGVREKSLRPLVGFCGYVGSVWKRRLYQWSGRSDKAIGLVLRDRALGQLKGSARIETAFIERTDVWGGAVVSGGYDEHKREAVREEFVSNLVGSDYGLCLRGKGNYSFRLYEIFAVGRIPLFIDTECVLPFEDEIDWRRHCVWVDAQDIDRIDEILAQFHADIAPDDFRRLQLDNRRLWEEWLRPQAFYTRMLERALRDGGAG